MFTRRQFLVNSAMATAAVQTRYAFSVAPASTRVAAVSEGLLRGEMRDGFQIFRGVPFARPPIGPLRFCPPQSMLPWTGVRDAMSFAAAPVQPEKDSLPQSEDCLYLNIWAPQQGGPFPVFVWIHGGGLTGGCSCAPLSNGERFAQDGVVCITISYRLGALGFLDVSPLLGPTYAGSANNALRDLIVALQWVQTNVKTFGGDPRRVTIGGESAGAKLTDLLMGIPSAAPLFQQVISESGGAERISLNHRAQQVGQAFGAAWTQQTRLPASSLQTASATQIIDVQQRFQSTFPLHFPFRPQLDEQLIPRPPIAAIRAGSARGKRLLIGTNRDESALFIGPSPQKPPGPADLGNLTIDQFQPIADRYAQLYPQMSDPLRRIRSVTAEEYMVPSTRVAEAHVAAGGQAFVYRLDFPGTGRFAGLAFHSYDLRFVWNAFGAAAIPAPERALTTAMHTAWVSFIRGDSPTAPGLPSWPAFTLSQRPTMIFDSTSRVEFAPNADELALWNGLLMN